MTDFYNDAEDLEILSRCSNLKGWRYSQIIMFIRSIRNLVLAVEIASLTAHDYEDTFELIAKIFHNVLHLIKERWTFYRP